MIAGTRNIFGVSGLLYRRNVLMYDRQKGSLWSQVGLQAVTGPLVGTSLSILPVEHTTWEDWRRRYPDTQVLSFRTGHSRDYDRDPYRNSPIDRREAAAVFSGETVTLYPFSELRKTQGTVRDGRLRIDFEAESRRLEIQDEQGEPVDFFVAFLADLRVFYPEAAVFRASGRR